MSKRKHDYRFVESAVLNNATYLYFYEWLTELAISMYKWEGFPAADPGKNLPGVDPDFLEYVLFNDGRAVIFKDDVMGLVCMEVNLNDKMNIYRVPIRRTAHAVNGFHSNLTPKNSVVVFNNALRTPTAITLDAFARRLYEIQRTMDVNIKAQKTPVVIQGTDEQRLTLINLYKQYEGNEPFVFGFKNLDLGALTAIRTDAPFVSDKLQALKIQVWNEALSYLGISNVNYEKRERLVKEEVNASMGGTLASRNSRLNMRKKACDEINNMFDLNVSVSYNEEVEDIVKQATDAVLGGGENVKVYDRS